MAVVLAEHESASAQSTVSDADDSSQSGDKPLYAKAFDIGKRFSVLFCPWPELEALRAVTQQRPRIDVHSHIQRYGPNGGGYLTAMTAEIWDSFVDAPDARDALADDPSVAKKVRLLHYSSTIESESHMVYMPVPGRCQQREKQVCLRGHAEHHHHLRRLEFAKQHTLLPPGPQDLQEARRSRTLAPRRHVCTGSI